MCVTLCCTIILIIVLFSIEPTISNFTIGPTMVAVLESTCPDSDPHDNFTLVCRARKPAVVIPQLMVQWLHNGSMRAGDLSVSDNGAYVVNALSVSEAEVSDAGLYQCVATIMIPDSPTVNTSASSMVDITGELKLVIYHNELKQHSKIDVFLLMHTSLSDVSP